MKDDWSRPLTRPLDIPGIIKIKTLADVLLLTTQLYFPNEPANLRDGLFHP
jgi:hypothetical protein